MGRMNRRLAMAGVWCTGGFFLVWAIGYAGLAQWVPPLSPDLSAAQTAAEYSDNATAIRIGMVLMTMGSALYLPWTVLLAQIIRQIERGGRMLAWTQLLAGLMAAMTFMLPAYIWAAISFRADRDPQVAQMLSDLGWLLFITAIAPFILQYLTLAVAIFMDDREVPAFPRWVGYLQVWVSLSFLPACLAFFFKDGPFAWNGLFVWWVPLTMFTAWFAVIIFSANRAVKRGYADPPEYELVARERVAA